MDEDSIRDAWEQSVAKLPVMPDEIEELVMQVAYELASAASIDGETDFDEENWSVNLPHGLTVSWDENKEMPNGVQKSQFYASVTRTEINRIRAFSAQAGLTGPPAVSDPTSQRRPQILDEGERPGEAVDTGRTQTAGRRFHLPGPGLIRPSSNIKRGNHRT